MQAVPTKEQGANLQSFVPKVSTCCLQEEIAQLYSALEIAEKKAANAYEQGGNEKVLSLLTTLGCHV